MLISCPVTIQLNCAFVFVYAENRFSHDAAQLLQLFLEGQPNYKKYFWGFVEMDPVISDHASKDYLQCLCRKITIWEPKHDYVI